MLVEATVKDAAGHSETRGEPITVSESPLLITAVPEGGTLIPGLENQVFVLTSYADGKPAKTELRVRAAGNPRAGRPTRTRAAWPWCRWRRLPTPRTLQVEASDERRATALSRAVPLELRAGRRADSAAHRARRISAPAIAFACGSFPRARQGAVYVDAVKDGQTVLTRDLDLTNGQAELTLTATPDAGRHGGFQRLPVRPRCASGGRPPAGCSWSRPSELKIEATADAAEYKPGDDARIQFRVTNERGEGVQAALGVQVVDEAVFALAEKQPGFAKVFFYLEQEAMKPRYEIHSIGMPEVVETAGGVRPGPGVVRKDLAARALFAATEMVNTNGFDREFGRAVPQTRYNAYATRYRTRFEAQVERLAEDCNRTHRTPPQAAEVRDAWDTPVKVQPVYGGMFLVRSAGPDKRFDDGDDLYGYLRSTMRKVAQPADFSGGRIAVRMEHEEGPFNGLAQIAGAVTDLEGVGAAGAAVAAREIGSGKTRTTRSDEGGLFYLTGVPAGEYEVQVSLEGRNLTSRRFSLEARDRAVVSTTLAVRTANQTVWVAAAGFGRGEGGGFGPGALEFKVGGGVALGMLGGGGGGRGGMGGPAMAKKALAVPMEAPMPERAAMQMGAMGASFTIDGAVALDSVGVTNGSLGGVAPAPHVRSYFPEALYINPEIITDGDGRASISIPLADSITTWRMAMMASTARGALGSGTSSLKVFQDFFVDLDLPVTLTQGDRVSIPVAVYNYSGARGDVTLQLAEGRLVLAGRGHRGEEPRGGCRPRRRVAIHHRGQPHRQIQADAGGAHGRRLGPTAAPISWCAKSKSSPTAASRARSSTAAWIPPCEHAVTFPAGFDSGRQHDPGAALSRSAEPGDRRHGRHSAHALRLLRADLLEHLSQRAGARLHEAHQASSRPKCTPRPKASSPTAISACSPSKCPAADSPGSARRRPTRF